MNETWRTFKRPEVNHLRGQTLVILLPYVIQFLATDDSIHDLPDQVRPEQQQCFRIRLYSGNTVGCRQKSSASALLHQTVSGTGSCYSDVFLYLRTNTQHASVCFHYNAKIRYDMCLCAVSQTLLCRFASMYANALEDIGHGPISCALNTLQIDSSINIGSARHGSCIVNGLNLVRTSKYGDRAK